MSKKLSEELRHCLEDDACGDCQYHEQETKLTCRGLLQKSYEVVRAYEEFEEIFRSKMTDAACDFLKDKEEFTKWLDRNKWITKKCDEYARAEEQGKLLKLPCAVGDTVYRFYTVDDVIKIYEHCITTLTNIVNIMEAGDIGKTVFLTKEEAEQALKEMEGKK